MITKSRFVLALALVLALGVSAVAFGDGASENTPFVDGKVSPNKKLPAKKADAKKVSLLLGLRNENAVTGQQSNPASEEISVDKKIDVSGIADRPDCPAAPANGASPEQARASCPDDAYLVSGEAATQFPGLPLVDDITVTVLKGPAGAQPPAGRRAALSIPLILHTSSPTLRTSSPSVQAYLVKSRAGKKYGSTLWVPNTPETGSGLIVKFNALLDKSAGVKAYCDKSKKFRFLRHVIYKDGSQESVDLKQPCKAKPSK